MYRWTSLQNELLLVFFLVTFYVPTILFNIWYYIKIENIKPKIDNCSIVYKAPCTSYI